jgi:hypothetical protein
MIIHLCVNKGRCASPGVEAPLWFAVGIVGDTGLTVTVW